jgi:CBS-domain-containing membrane protein
MATKNSCQNLGPLSIELSDDDVLSAMKSIPGYLDITTADFREIYQLAYRHAHDRLGRSVTAADIMTEIVISVSPETDLLTTARYMADHAISGLPVVDNQRIVVGVISEKDFLRKMGASDVSSFMGVVATCLSNKGCLALPMRNQAAGDIMTAPAITAAPDTPVAKLSKLLKEHQINRIPIVDGENKIRGIVSRGDLVDSFCANVL